MRGRSARRAHALTKDRLTGAYLVEAVEEPGVRLSYPAAWDRIEPMEARISMGDTVFTSGRWTVKAGHEDDFVAAWREFAEWSKATYPATSGWVVLLRDREHANVFLSVGPWAGLAAIDEWRSNEGFRSRIGALRALLDGFEAATLDAVVDLH